MAITEAKKNIDISIASVQFICPVCKTKKTLDIPKSVIEEAKQLTTMSIARGLVCNHQFQAYVDKNYQVRGYQKVDFEFENTVHQEEVLDSNNTKQDDSELIENLILEGNYVEYNPLKTKIKIGNNIKNKEITSQKKKMTLKEIYDEFWELIDDNNEEFKVFLRNDLRRN